MPYANNDGVKIYYEVEGVGPTLVMLHGGGSDLKNWQDRGYAESLRKDYRLILIDQRGHGRSDKPTESRLYDMEYRVSDIITVLDDLHVMKAHFLGYSQGGRMALECAKVVPQRVVSEAIGGIGPQGKSTDGTNTLLPVFEAKPETFRPGLSEEEMKRFMATDYPALLACLKSPWPNLEADLPNMTMPFLVFLGELDHLWPPEITNKAYSILPNVKFVILPGLDHMTAFRRSDFILPHIKEFLAGVSKT